MMTERQWQLNFPITKAIQDGGKFVVEGLAATPGIDAEGERVLATGLADSLPYLEAHGHYNWNHTDIILGDIQKARIVDGAWAQKHFNLPKAPEGKCLYLKGFLYEPNDEMPEEQRRILQMVRGTLAAGGRMGKSVEGVRRRVGVETLPDGSLAKVTTEAFIRGCAITPSPVNPEAFVRPVTLAKSFAEAMTVDDGEGPIVINCVDVGESERSCETITQQQDGLVGPVLAAGFRRVAKALTTTDTDVTSALRGGDALRLSDFGRRRKRRRKRKPPLGSGKRFRELSEELADRGVRDPDALAAWIGRRKYGKARMAKLAAKGRRAGGE